MLPPDLRAHFPHAAHQTYVNHAAVSPLSRPVKAAIDDYLRERHGADPEAPIANFESFRSVVAETKERTARMLQTESSRIEFVPNTSTGLNLVARGLDWEEGDRIAIPHGTFPTNVYPFLNLEHAGVAVDFVPTDEGAFSVDDVEEILRPETRLLSVSWVHFLSGFQADLKALGSLCDEYDVLFCVDAIQGLGALEIDVEGAGIDVLASGGHKWLMATQGIGLFYCTEAFQEHVRPPTGWLHGPVDWDHLDRYDLTFHQDARRFRTGTVNSVGVAALHAALGLYLDAGPEWCEERVLELSSTLEAEFTARGIPRYGSDEPRHASGIITIAPEHPEEFIAHLDEHGITAAMRNRKIRFSPTYYNDQSDLAAILDAIDSVPSRLDASD